MKYCHKSIQPNGYLFTHVRNSVDALRHLMRAEYACLSAGAHQTQWVAGWWLVTHVKPNFNVLWSIFPSDSIFFTLYKLCLTWHPDEDTVSMPFSCWSCWQAYLIVRYHHLVLHCTNTLPQVQKIASPMIAHILKGQRT